MDRIIVLIAALLAFAPYAGAQQNPAPRLIADVSSLPLPLGSNPDNFVAVGSTVFFTADEPLHGREIYAVRATDSRATLVADIAPGPADSNPRALSAALNGAYFLIKDANDADQVWFSDGAATRQITDNLGASGTACWLADGRATTKSFVCVEQTPAGLRYRWWSSDGSVGGTKVLKVEAATQAIFDVHSLAQSAGNSWLIVRPAAPVGGCVLWRSDGTVVGTTGVADIGACDEAHSALTLTDGRYLAVVHKSFVYKLISSSGTAATTTTVLAPSGKTMDQRLTSLGSIAVFSLHRDADGVGELWRTDGSVAGTSMLREIGAASLNAALPTNLVSVGSHALFTGSYYGAAIPPADVGGSARVTWVTDGSSAGTWPIYAPSPPIVTANVIAPFNERALFAAPVGNVLFDAISGQMTQLIAPTELAGHAPSNRGIEVAGTIYLTEEGIGGPELWRIASGSSQELLFHDLWPATANTLPHMANSSGDQQGFYESVDSSVDAIYWKAYVNWVGFFQLNSSTLVKISRNLVTAQHLTVPQIAEKHVIDFEINGDRLVIQTNGPATPEYNFYSTNLDFGDPQLLAGPCGSADMVSLGAASLLMCRQFGVNQPQSLLRTFGHIADTSVVAEMASVNYPLVWRAFFMRRTGATALYFMERHGQDESGATVENTLSMSDGQSTVVTAPSVSGVVNTTAVQTIGGKVLVARGAPVDLPQLVSVSDAGVVTDLGPIVDVTGQPRIDFRDITPLADGRAVFVVNGASTGPELWITDGTRPGTHRQVSFGSANSPNGGSGPILVAAGPYIYVNLFRDMVNQSVAAVPISDWSIRWIDMPADTLLRMQIGSPDGRAFGGGYDPAAGNELWEADPMAMQAHRRADLWPGPESSSPDAFYLSGNDLVFFATDPIVGHEPFALALDGLFGDGFE